MRLNLIDHMTFRHFLIGIFAVANNFPALGPFLQLCNGSNKEEVNRLALIATLSALITMLIALFLGQSILSFFDISIDAFRMTGGLILCMSGLKMLNSNPEEHAHNSDSTTFAKKIPAVIVPIAIPLTTGAGTIATITIFAGELDEAKQSFWWLLLAIFTMTLMIYYVFKYSTKLIQVLGNTGMDVMIKITGLFTIAIGIQFIFNSLSSVFPGLR